MGSTLYCVYCLKQEAVEWTGHVMNGDEAVLAGWCAEHKNIPAGFVGHYLGAMSRRTKAARPMTPAAKETA